MRTIACLLICAFILPGCAAARPRDQIKPQGIYLELPTTKNFIEIKRNTLTILIEEVNKGDAESGGTLYSYTMYSPNEIVLITKTSREALRWYAVLEIYNNADGNIVVIDPRGRFIRKIFYKQP
jgi:hypothetical protein